MPSLHPHSRRDFLTESATAALALTSLSTLPKQTLAAGEPKFPADDVTAGFVDAHSHIWTPDLKKYPLAGKQTAADLKPPSFATEELLELAKKHRVSRVVLIQHRPYHGFDNSYIVDAIAAHKGRFSGVACVDLLAPDVAETMQKLVKQGFRGLRIVAGEGGKDRWIDSEGMNRVWHAATHTEPRFAICPLIGPEIIPQVSEMCEKYPDVTVVVDHFARIGIDGKIREKDVAALCGLAKHKHTHVKISAFYALGKKRPPHSELAPMTKRLFEAFGPQRLMWGSDCPYQLSPPNDYATSLRFIQRDLGFLSNDDRNWLLKGTAAKVFFGENPGCCE